MSATEMLALGIVIFDYFSKQTMVNAANKKIQTTILLAAMLAQKNHYNSVYAHSYNALLVKEHPTATTIDQKLVTKRVYNLGLILLKRTISVK